ncbi:MAG: AgmX/PglI C-terminal domain-containing protein [Oligoflexales bacterium]
MSRKNKNHIYIQILQNGAPVVETDCTIASRQKLSITSGLRGVLALPLYPLPAPIELIRTQKSQCFLNILPAFGGYYTSKGEVHDLHAHHHSEQQVLMISGDYASLVLGDLRILIRIGDPPKIAPVVKKDWKYRGKLTSMMFDSSTEVWCGVGAFFSTAFLFACLLAAFSYHKSDRPKHFEELADTYTLPFIAPQNIEFAPEALQHHLNRDRYVPSIVNYYRNVIRIVSGTGGNSDLFFESLSKKNRNFWTEHKRKKEAFIARHQDEISNVDTQTLVQLHIPSITGIPLKTQASHVLHRLRAMHISFDKTLETRRTMTKAFVNDHSYDWGKFSRKVQLKGIKKNKKKKSNGFGRTSDEENMYAEATRLAAQAKSYQKKHKRRYSQASDYDLRYIHLKPSPTLTFLENNNIEDKLQSLQASTFGKQQKLKVLEPLIGEIQPSAILQAIEYRQLQLKLCYELALRRNQSAKGKMDWTWRIDTRGKPSDFHLLGSTIEDRQMIQCVRKKLAQWTFPQPRYGSVLITHSFHFSPESDVSL